jgi:hypothetical protein
MLTIHVHSLHFFVKNSETKTKTNGWMTNVLTFQRKCPQAEIGRVEKKSLLGFCVFVFPLIRFSLLVFFFVNAFDV